MDDEIPLEIDASKGIRGLHHVPYEAATTSSVTTEDHGIISTLLRSLLEGAMLIAFKYDSWFTVHFQHDLPRPNSDLPTQVSLVLRAKWWIAIGSEIIPKAIVPEMQASEKPLQAFNLMTLVGSNVEDIELGVESSLQLHLSDGSISVVGREDEWEFSWYVFVPSNFPGMDAWSVHCDSLGEIRACWPSAAYIPQT